MRVMIHLLTILQLLLPLLLLAVIMAARLLFLLLLQCHSYLKHFYGNIVILSLLLLIVQ